MHIILQSTQNEKTAYFFGFVLGDGCLYHKPNRNAYQISIQVNERDKNVLEMWLFLIKVE